MSPAAIRALAALAVGVSLGAAVPGAAAQDFPPETPRGAPVVAGPTPSGARLVVFDSKRRLCGDVRRAREYLSSGDCTRPSGRLRDPLLQTEFDGRGRRAWHWGVVAPEVAAVELVLRGGLSVKVPTEAGSAYTGRFAGRVRFFIAEAEGRRGQQARYAKLLAADGSLLAVVDMILGYQVRVGHAVELARGRVGHGRWSLRAFRRRTLAPLPGDEEHFAQEDCVEVRPRAHGSLGEVCMNGDFPDHVPPVSTEQDCAAVGSVALGLVGPEVRSVRAILGDGRMRPLRVRRLPARYGDKRVFVLVLGPRVAVRRIVSLDRAGRAETLQAGLPPGTARCGDSGGVIVAYTERLPRPTGPLAFTVYDDGVLLCATLGRPAADGRDCGYPPLDDYEARILTRRAEGRTLVAGVVPAQAATAVVELVGGERRRVQTTTDGPYAGRYRGFVRFFEVELPQSARIRVIRLLDAQGRRLWWQPGDEEQQVVAGPRQLLPGSGGMGLAAELQRFPAFDREYLCVWLGRAASSHDRECGFPSAGFAQLNATCSPRRLFLWGLLPRRVGGVTVETDRGPVRAQTATLPRALRARGVQAVYLAVIPADAAPKALVLGAQAERRRLRLPPAASQCGYQTFLTTYESIGLSRR